MKVLFENPDKINGLMTLTVEKTDYQEQVEKQLKEYRKKANIPGFRPGQVPMGLIKRQYAMPLKMDAINKVVGEQIYQYVRENKIQMLGEPLPSEKQVPQDLEGDGPFTFIFDIAVAPEIQFSLSGRDKVTYYKIAVDDELINRQADMYASRGGSYEKADAYDPEQRDMLKGTLRELDEKGHPKKGGIELTDAVLMPEYMKVDDQKKLFDGAKLGDTVVFSPRKAYPESDVEVSALLKIQKDEVKDHEGDFAYEITEISRFKKHDLNQELFDQLYGEGKVKTEEEFRQKIADELNAQFVLDSDYKFLQDIRKRCEKKIGKLEYPDAILKRVMEQNNKDKDADFVEKNYEGSIKELTWHLVKEKLVADLEVKVEDQDVIDAAKESTRMQFAQYGMTNIPDEYIENYAKEMLKKQENIQPLVDRAVDKKLTEALKTKVKLEEETVSLDDFNKLMSEK